MVRNFKWNQPYLIFVLNLIRSSNSLNLASLRLILRLTPPSKDGKCPIYKGTFNMLEFMGVTLIFISDNFCVVSYKQEMRKSLVQRNHKKQLTGFFFKNGYLIYSHLALEGTIVKQTLPSLNLVFFEITHSVPFSVFKNSIYGSGNTLTLHIFRNIKVSTPV